MATLHFIYGWPGAGKTTLARTLGERERGAVFCLDEWLAALTTEPITTLAQFVDASGRIRRVIGPLATRLLGLGVPVVFDFAGNTVAQRAWVKGLAEAAGAEHLLHVLDVPADECRRRLHARNATRPEGLYFGDVSDELLDAVVQHIVPPRDDEAIPTARAIPRTKPAYPILEISSGKGAICGAILATLPDWFGIESSNAAHVRDVERMAMFVAFDVQEPIGFLALNRHSSTVFENHVLGVRPQFHRRGLGRALMTRAEDYARSRAARLLTVKTLAPSHPDPGYALTRRFYQAMGFFPLEEFPTLWNAENPCLFMAKILD